MGSSLSSKIKTCPSIAASFFASAPPPLPQQPPPATRLGIEVDYPDENTNGLSINTHSTGSRQTHSTSPTASSTDTSNPIAEAIREMGKPFLTIIPALMVYLWDLDVEGDRKWYRDMALCMLSVAFTTLYTGISLANVRPQIANILCQVGIGCTCLTFFMLVGSRLPAEQNFLPAICCVVCLVVSICSTLLS